MSSSELSSINKLCILASKENITLTASGSRSDARNKLKLLLASAAAFDASRECDGMPLALRFTGAVDVMMNTDNAVIKRQYV